MDVGRLLYGCAMDGPIDVLRMFLCSPYVFRMCLSCPYHHAERTRMLQEYHPSTLHIHARPNRVAEGQAEFIYSDYDVDHLGRPGVAVQPATSTSI